MTKTLQREATRIHTHTIVFSPDSKDEEVLSRVLAGRSTKFICQELGVSPGQVSYYVRKAGYVGERMKFRNGETEFAKMAYTAIRKATKRRIQASVAPRFEKFAPR